MSAKRTYLGFFVVSSSARCRFCVFVRSVVARLYESGTRCNPAPVRGTPRIRMQPLKLNSGSVMRQLFSTALVVLSFSGLTSCLSSANGTPTLVLIDEIDPDEACPSGAVRILAGLDEDDDGELEVDEVSQEAVICNARDRTPGEDGFSTLTDADDQVGNACDAYGNGGQRIRSGLDNGDGEGVARDGQLHDDEVDTETYVCNGSNEQSGGSLLRTETELGGPNCPYGGVRILSGIDDNEDGTLQGDAIHEGEVDSIAYVCSDVPGACAPGYHDGGNGACVEEDICASGYERNQDGYCLVPLQSYEVIVASGSFQRDEFTATISKSMAMMKTEVTQGLWKTLSGGVNPSYHSDCDGQGGDTCPVEEVDWFSAVGFANALSASRGLTPCYTITGCSADDWRDGSAPSCTVVYADSNDPLSCNGYRLPTEAEWEYAYRAGTTTDFYSGDMTNGDCDDPLLDALGWYCGNANNTTHPVAQKNPNNWGLFDMAGNVFEWTWDWRAEYPGALVDYFGPPTGNRRIWRGGSWNNNANLSRAAYRGDDLPGTGSNRTGFRLTRTLSPETP